MMESPAWPPRNLSGDVGETGCVSGSSGEHTVLEMHIRLSVACEAVGCMSPGTVCSGEALASILAHEGFRVQDEDSDPQG